MIITLLIWGLFHLHLYLDPQPPPCRNAQSPEGSVFQLWEVPGTNLVGGVFLPTHLKHMRKSFVKLDHYFPKGSGGEHIWKKMSCHHLASTWTFKSGCHLKPEGMVNWNPLNGTIWHPDLKLLESSESVFLLRFKIRWCHAIFFSVFFSGAFLEPQSQVCHRALLASFRGVKFEGRESTWRIIPVWMYVSD